LSKLCCQLKQSLCNQQAPVFSAITCRCQKICQSGCYLTFWLWLWLWRQTKTKTIRTSAYLRLRLRRGKASCYTPRWQLDSKAIPFKLDHVIPSNELTHDTMAVGGATKCCNVQPCTCLDADFWLLLYSNAHVWMQTFDCCCIVESLCSMTVSVTQSGSERVMSNKVANITSLCPLLVTLMCAKWQKSATQLSTTNSDTIHWHWWSVTLSADSVELC